MDTLEPPATLTPPEPVQAVPEEQAGQMVKLDPKVVPELDQKVDAFIDVIMQQGMQSPEFQKKVQSIHAMGNDEMRKAASVSNRMLERPANAMDNGVFDENSPISRSLMDLRNTVEDLDPSRQGEIFSTRKLAKWIPGGNKVRNYFLKYQSSQKHLNGILDSLYRGQDELRKDNAALEQEKVNLWNNMQVLQQYIYVGKKLDDRITERVAEIEIADPEKARVVKEEMLFYARQKVQDLLMQMAVSIQSYLALDMVRKNNLELIKGVDRATTTTVSALRVAIITAQALENQKLVLNQINAINRTASDLIERNARMLRQQAAEVHAQASSTGIEMEKLQSAFNNIYAAMDEMSEYKMHALDSMKETVNVLSSEVQKAEGYLDRVRLEQASSAVGDISIDTTPEIGSGLSSVKI